MNVFIDTNVFLDFYGFSKDLLNKLEELEVLITKGKIKLFLPRQVIDEFNRNRDGELKKILDKLKSFAQKLESPIICRDWPEMKQLREEIAKVDKSHKKLLQTVTKKIKARSLEPDSLISWV